MAPELLRRSGYREAIDWWSLGVVMYECMFGRGPFEGSSKAELTKAILKGQYPIVKQKYSNDCIEFLKGLLKMNPRRRLGFEDGNHYLILETAKMEPNLCNCFQETKGEEGGDSENINSNNGANDHVKMESSFKNITRHNFFKGIDWELMTKKLIPSPYRPNPSKFHFDLIHEVNLIFDEKKILKYRKPKSLSRGLNFQNADREQQQRQQLLEVEFKDYNWEI